MNEQNLTASADRLPGRCWRWRLVVGLTGLGMLLTISVAPRVWASDEALPETVVAGQPGGLASSPLPPERPAPSRLQVRAAVEEFARIYGLEFALIDSLVVAESAYDPYAVSSAGAIGLMQVMPATARDYGVEDASRLFDVAVNLRTGMRHLRRLLARYPTLAQAVMAYNAGTDRSDYPETIRYTHAVLSRYLRGRGIDPYSLRAQAVVGIRLTPAMARAGLAGGSATRGLPTPNLHSTHTDALPEASPQPEKPSRLSARDSSLATGTSRLSSRLMPRRGAASLLGSRLQDRASRGVPRGLQGRALQRQTE